MIKPVRPIYRAVDAVRRVENGRLVYYKRKAPDTAYWDAHWQPHLTPHIYEKAKQGRLGRIQDPVSRYLPKEGRILEAGCGLGQNVLALRHLGYEAEGVEWGEATVRAVLEICPDLPIRVGDVTQLDVPDGTYSGYISLGVVEHHEDGPEAFLREAYRVVMSGGIIFVSVPHFHWLRRLKARLGLYRGQSKGLEFYQYAFTVEEFTGIVRSQGFDILDIFHYGPLKGIKDEIGPIRFLLNRRFIGPRLAYRLNQWKYAQRKLGHMLLAIAERP